MGEEGARQEVEVGEEVLPAALRRCPSGKGSALWLSRSARFGGINARADAAAAAVVEHVEQRQMRALRPPAVRGGVELPERADFGALPAADTGFGFARRLVW